MWWLFPVQILQAQNPISFSLDFSWAQVYVNQFLLLGIVPGTNIQITFTAIIIGLWCGFIAWLGFKAFPEAIQFIRYQKSFASKLRDIDLSSL
jgi:flagellar biosynthesis protein FliR